jgi:hypothetical protein
MFNSLATIDSLRDFATPVRSVDPPLAAGLADGRLAANAAAVPEAKTLTELRSLDGRVKPGHDTVRAIGAPHYFASHT